MQLRTCHSTHTQDQLRIKCNTKDHEEDTELFQNVNYEHAYVDESSKENI